MRWEISLETIPEQPLVRLVRSTSREERAKGRKRARPSPAPEALESDNEVWDELALWFTDKEDR